jgi:L-fuconolactonase
VSSFASIHAPRDEWLARAEPEEALEPDLAIVDAHLHLWHYGGHRYLIEEYAQDIAESGHKVEASVYVECSNMYRATGPEHLKPVGETEFVVGQAAMAASHKYTTSKVAQVIVGHANLLLGEQVREVLQAHVAAANGRFRGIRYRAKWDADTGITGSEWNASGPGIYLRPEFGNGLDVLASMGLSFDASVYHPQLPDVVALARKHPQARIVIVHTSNPLGHSSYAGKQAENHARFLSDLRELATCPNVFMKLGGMVMHLIAFDYLHDPAPPTSRRLAELWRPWIEPCIELFGPDRVMVEGNFPVDKMGISYRTVWNMFKHLTASCSADEKKAIFSGTARRFYRMD